MSDETFLEKAAKNLKPGDFVDGLYQGAVEKPLNGIRQLVGKNVEAQTVPADGNAQSQDTLAGKAGFMAGQIIDFSVVALLSRKALAPVLKKSLDSTAGSAATMFVAGAVDGGVLTKSAPEKSLLLGRTESALTMGTTFAVMGGASKALEARTLLPGSLPFKIPAQPFLEKGLKSAAAGAVGGAAGAYSNAFFHEHRLASASEVASSAGQFAAFGFGLHALQTGVAKTAGLPAVESAYYRSKWNLQEGATEAKRLSYAALNELGLRHPVQRLTDAVYSRLGKLPADLPKAPLTKENNPITAFDKEFAEYIEKVRRAEQKYEAAPHSGRREIYDEMGEVHAGFVEKLLGNWYGSAQKPGISSYSDAELALASGQSVERVAAIRSAYTQSMKRESYHGPSPFEEAMAKLAPSNIAGEQEAFEIARGLGMGRERFFNYDESKLGSKLALRSEHHHYARAYGTPVSWMPFEATPNLANLFHATVSRALDSTLIERGLLPAREMRLRGIQQLTGESANEQFGRRAISMTRDFSEAFCYHRHSPEVLTDFPVVFGISRDVTKRAWSAGSLEPGEILIDKLHLGSIWQKLGLKKPDVTHIYVPDSQVPFVNLALARRRVSGVRVVGFNQMESPEWLPVPLRSL
ncbi:MAG: hypothetical protein IPM93_06995 [Candidatus Obscuribacter sp.]|nr:hypothetical protein [Candidatus Obscuribacter sp.]